MPIRLSLEAESVEEFDTFIARFARVSTMTMIVEPKTAAEATMPETTTAEEPKTRGRKSTKAAEPTQLPDGTVIPPVSEPLPQPTPGGTDAPPSESIPPKQEAGNAEQSGATATETSGGSASQGGEVTMQNLKDAMSGLIKAKSASVAMATLEAAAGCKSLTSGSPSVAEKANDDPAIMRKVLDALNAAAVA